MNINHARIFFSSFSLRVFILFWKQEEYCRCSLHELIVYIFSHWMFLLNRPSETGGKHWMARHHLNDNSHENRHRGNKIEKRERKCMKKHQRKTTTKTTKSKTKWFFAPSIRSFVVFTQELYREITESTERKRYSTEKKDTSWKKYDLLFDGLLHCNTNVDGDKEKGKKKQHTNENFFSLKSIKMFVT